MSLVFEKLTQYLSAGQVWRLTIAADFFRIAAAEWPVKVRILKAGRILGEMDGWQSGDFVRDVDFDAVEVEAGAIAQAVTVQIAGGGVGSDRVLGEVSVIDGASSNTKAGIAFLAGVGENAAAGTFATLSFVNPAASAVEVAIRSFSVTLQAAGIATISAEPPGGGAALQTMPTSSKLIGSGKTPAAQFWTEAATVAAGGNYMEIFNFGAAGREQRELREPILLEAGQAITMKMATANVAANLVVEWVEL